MGYIYIITNDINNKVYIGKTSRTIQKRWREHIDDATCSQYRAFKTHFHKALRKYGKEHFQIKILEEVKNNNLLPEREQYWINEYDSYKNGYNSTIGGEGAIKYDYQKFLELWKQGFSTKEISQKFNCEVTTVYNALSSFPGWSEESVQRRNLKACQAMQESRKIPVDCYDLNGCFLASYNSSREAAKALGVTESGISNSLKKGHRVDKYLFVKHGETAPLPYQKTGSKAVNQYDLEGKFIASYRSMADAAKALGKPKKSAACSIAKVYNKTRHTAYGYRWEWKNNDENN